MTIQIEKATEGTAWRVKVNSVYVTFRNAAEAMAYTQTLKSRIEAPHPFPKY